MRLIAGLPAAGASFRITSILRNPNGGVTMAWQSEAGAAYSIESTAILGSQWNTMAADVPGLADSTSFTDTNTTGAARFYRVLRR